MIDRDDADQAGRDAIEAGISVVALRAPPFSYNFGRGVGTLFPSVIGFLSASMPLGRAIGIFAASAYACAVLRGLAAA